MSMSMLLHIVDFHDNVVDVQNNVVYVKDVDHVHDVVKAVYIHVHDNFVVNVVNFACF
jgi:hypothetical protein